MIGEKMIGDFIKNNLASYLQNNWQDLMPTFKKVFAENKQIINDAVVNNQHFDEYKTKFNWSYFQCLALEFILKKEFGGKYDELFEKIGKIEFQTENDLEMFFINNFINKDNQEGNKNANDVNTKKN